MEEFLSLPLHKIMRPTHHIQKDRPVRELVNLLLNHSISEALVTDESGKPVGVVTKTDILRHSVQYITHKTETEVYKKTEDGHIVPLMPRKAEILEVEKIMSPKIFSLSQDSTAKEAIEFMLREEFHRIFVHKSPSKEIVGVVGVREILGQIMKD